MATLITTVLFDLGDTLWHLPQMPAPGVIRGETMRRVEELIRRWGYDMSGDRPLLGRDIRLAVSEETHRAFHGDCVDPGYPELCRRVAREHGLDLTEQQGEELWEAWNLGGLFFKRALFPDVIPTLSELKVRGFRIASVTNRGYSGPDFWDEVRHFGLDDLLEAIVISCDVGYMKPHPRIYHAALERLSVEAEECIMVGDNLRADVEGPKTLGMTAVWRRPTADEPVEATTDEREETGPVQPDYTIEQIAELLDLPPLRSAA